MARADLINKMYSLNKTPLEFQFDSLLAPPLMSLLTPYDIKLLNDVAKDPRLSANVPKKMDIIKSIVEPRGFVKLHAGTNRIVYRYLEDQSFVIKIAFDKGGLPDNPAEYKNQFLLAPFITKVFEHTPCGTVGLFERVEPITSREEFTSIAPDIFDLLNEKIIGKYIMEDIGTEYFMNWGLRVGFGPVLLDFPYCYELDGNKLYCNKINDHNLVCRGSIDYDDGFNNLVCTRCGSRTFAVELQKKIDNNDIKMIKKGKGRSHMIVEVYDPRSGKTTQSDTRRTAKSYADMIRGSKNPLRKSNNNKKEKEKMSEGFRVEVYDPRGENKVYDVGIKEDKPVKKRESSLKVEVIEKKEIISANKNETVKELNLTDKVIVNDKDVEFSTVIDEEEYIKIDNQAMGLLNDKCDIEDLGDISDYYDVPMDDLLDMEPLYTYALYGNMIIEKNKNRAEEHYNNLASGKYEYQEKQSGPYGYDKTEYSDEDSEEETDKESTVGITDVDNDYVDEIMNSMIPDIGGEDD